VATSVFEIRRHTDFFLKQPFFFFQLSKKGKSLLSRRKNFGVAAVLPGRWKKNKGGTLVILREDLIF
jgi:hypothetical protein